MDKLFKTEKTKMLEKRQLSSDEEKAEDVRISLTAKKRSLLPKASIYIILSIFKKNMSLNTKKMCFQSLMTKMMKMIMKQKTKKKMSNLEILNKKSLMIIE